MLQYAVMLQRRATCCTAAQGVATQTGAGLPQHERVRAALQRVGRLALRQVVEQAARTRLPPLRLLTHAVEETGQDLTNANVLNQCRLNTTRYALEAIANAWLLSEVRRQALPGI